MITKMKKFTFLVTNKEYEHFLADIRKIGVVHVEELQSGSTSAEFEAGKALAERYKNALNALDFAQETYTAKATYKNVNLQSGTDVKAAGLKLVEEVERLLSEENSLKHKIESVEKNIQLLRPWGEFDASKLEELAQNGYQVNFYACPNKLFKQEWADEYFATPIDEIDKRIYFVTFSPERPDITAENLEIPQRPLSYYLNEKTELQARLEQVHENLLRINTEGRKTILASQVENDNDISLSKVHLCAESIADDAVKLMVGWIPVEKENEVEDYLDKNKIYYEAEDPSLDDDVPIEIKNGSYTSLFEPILRMYSLPNYHDLDITQFLAPFFMLFFGLCLGDAGYGLLVLVASIILLKKLDADSKPYAKLGIYLGAMTIVCGLLTGTFFGIDLSQQDWAFLAPVKKLFVNENNYTIFGYSPMMVVSVIIGLIQVLLGMVLSAVKASRLYGWKYGIGKTSWVVAIISAIICFGLPACGVALPTVVTYILYALMGICVLGIFFLNSPDKNIFLNFGTGLWDTYGMATGLLGDLLSYIRLFALGLTGGVLGGVFNQLAIDLTSSMPWAVRWLPMLLILLFGHGINFGLCMISSFVHPMRLTFVEFFKNANFEGGGKEYEPFRVKS
jgi:V/A-type H+-transporting ATPase subunit I